MEIFCTNITLVYFSVSAIIVLIIVMILQSNFGFEFFFTNFTLHHVHNQIRSCEYWQWKKKKTFRHVSYIYQAYCLVLVTSLSISFESLISFLHLAFCQKTVIDITFLHKEAWRSLLRLILRPYEWSDKFLANTILFISDNESSYACNLSKAAQLG